jgi:D-alanine transaminase
LLEAARREGIEVVERPFTPEEAKGAREAFVSASSAVIIPVIRIDDTVIGNGAPGSITLRLRQAYAATSLLT